jgi:hypothetical protein
LAAEIKGTPQGVDENALMPRGVVREVMIVSAIVLIAALGVRTVYQPIDPQGAIDRVEEIYDLDIGSPHPWFTAWALGDGQAYALIAADPSGHKLADNVREAAYRYARAGYGWSAGAIVLGSQPRVPYALASVGVIALLATLGLATWLRVRMGPRAWWIVLNPALYLGFAGDTSEPMAIALLVVAMAWDSWVAAALLGVTRPTYLVSVWGRWRLVLPGLAAASILAGYSLLAFGSDAMIPSAGRIGLPFVAYLDHISLAGVALLAVALVTTIIGARRREWAWVLAGVFVLCFGDDVLRDPINAWRAAGFVPVLWAFGPGYDPAVVKSAEVETASAST